MMPSSIDAQIAQLSKSHADLELAVSTLDDLAITGCDLVLVCELLRVEIGEHLLMIAAITAKHSRYWFKGFGLSSTERCVLWLLITGAWCPTMRRSLHYLQVDAAAPTVDAIRRIVYGAGTEVGSELGPTGMLWQLGLIRARTLELMQGSAVLDRPALKLANGVLETIQEDARRDLALTGCTSRCLPERHKALRKALGSSDLRREPAWHKEDE